MPNELIRELLARQSASGSRSTVLQPLSWLIGILLAGLVIAISRNAPLWAEIVLATLLVLAVALAMFFYCYFAINNPDALRSERYTLSKMAIEKNLIGDNRAGLIELSESSSSLKLKELPQEQIGQ